MHEYDTTLKLLLTTSGQLTMRELIGAPVVQWLEVELPKVQNLRVDLLGETSGGGLVHLELQSTHDPTMPLRMEYKLGIYRVSQRLPRQVLLYVGEAPFRMQTELHDEDLQFRYRAVDIRSLDGDLLLAGEGLGDNIIAILARLRDHKESTGSRSCPGLSGKTRWRNC